MTGAWTPLSKRESGDPAFDTLHPGIPVWVRPSVLEWVLAFYGKDRDKGEFFLQTQRIFRLAWNYETFLEQLNRGDAFLVDVVDFVLQHASFYAVAENRHKLERLEILLEESGSEWRVKWTQPGFYFKAWLERRILDASTNRLEWMTGPAGRAGQHLRKAWAELYGRTPDFGNSYSESVKAVEAAAIPVVCPNDKLATLGRVIGLMREVEKPWTVPLHPSDATQPAETLLSMLELIWRSHNDRHGSPDPQKPMQATQQEAETALHLAITLVHWFTAGLVNRMEVAQNPKPQIRPGWLGRKK